MWNWALPCSFFTVTSCEISTWTWGRALHILSRNCGEHSSCFRRMELFSGTEDCLVLRTVCTGSERTARWDVLRSGGWVSHRHCVTRVWSGDVCMCFSDLNVIPLTFKSSSRTEGHGHAFSVFTTIDVWGWNSFLPWNVKPYFRFCVQ